MKTFFILAPLIIAKELEINDTSKNDTSKNDTSKNDTSILIPTKTKTNDDGNDVCNFILTKSDDKSCITKTNDQYNTTNYSNKNSNKLFLLIFYEFLIF